MCGRSGGSTRSGRQPNCPRGIGHLPPITWFSASGTIDDGIAAVLRAETNSDEAAKNLRDVVQGFVALASLQAGSKPELKALAQSLEISGTGKTVALSFSVPGRLLDLMTAPNARPAERSAGALTAFCAIGRFASTFRRPVVYDTYGMTDLVFFYGTLMSGFKREGRTRVELALESVGRGSIQAVLFDIGIYPPPFRPRTVASTAKSIACLTPSTVLQALDEIEGYRHDQPGRQLVPACRDARSAWTTDAWMRRGYIFTTRHLAAPRVSNRATISHISK